MRYAFVFLIFLGSMELAAQYTVTISKNSSNQFVISQQAGFAAAGQVTTIAGDTPLIITCDASMSSNECNLLNVKVGAVTVPLSAGNPRTGTVRAADVSISGTRLRILQDATDIGSGFQMITPTTVTTPPPSAVTPGTPAARAGVTTVRHPCDTFRISSPYDRAGNRAHFVVTDGASFAQQPNGPIDEDDVIVFHIVSLDEALLQHLHVARTSPTRSTTDLNIIASGTSVARQSLGNKPCFVRTLELGDFEPGEAKVELYTLENNDKTVIGQPLTFNVNRLWHGMMSFGPMRSSIDTQSFDLAPRGEENIIVRNENATHDLAYVVQYTQFWRRRDTEKEYPWYQHINPSIAFALEQTLDQAFVGVSFDWREFVVTTGAHIREVDVLSPDSGLRVGDAFTGTKDDIPLETERRTGLYIGVSVDARAIRILFDAIATPRN